MADPERVRVTIELPLAHLPVVTYLLLAGGLAEQRRRPPVWAVADHLTDELIAAQRGVDASALAVADLEGFAAGGLTQLLAADLAGLVPLEETIDVDVERVDG